MKRVVAARSRNPFSNRPKDIQKMIDYISNAYRDMSEDAMEDILIRHNASEDDSGPEGYFQTMSDQDIRDAYQEIHDYIWESNKPLTVEEIRSKIYKCQSRDSSYNDGYLEAVDDLTRTFNLKI